MATVDIQFKIAISAFECVREHCPAYFNNVSIPVAGISGRANLRSAERHDMLVSSIRTQLGRRSFHKLKTQNTPYVICYLLLKCLIVRWFCGLHIHIKFRPKLEDMEGTLYHIALPISFSSAA